MIIIYEILINVVISQHVLPLLIGILRVGLVMQVEQVCVFKQQSSHTHWHVLPVLRQKTTVNLIQIYRFPSVIMYISRLLLKLGHNFFLVLLVEVLI